MIASEVPLRELSPIAETGPPDIVIRTGALRADLPTEAGHHQLPDGGLLVIPAVARYFARAGRELLIEPHPGVPERNLRLFLLGSGMGMLLHQRAMLPLHANAVAIDGRAVAFMGPSGAGKSTLAAWFLDHGVPLLCDDVCVIDFGSEGTPVVWPGLPRLRLWRDALERSGRVANDYSRSYEEDGEFDKYDVPAPSGSGESSSVSLGGFVLLERGETATLERLTPGDAVQALFANIYRGEYLSDGQHERQWRTCLRLGSQLGVQRWSRSWDLAHYDHDVAALMTQIRGQSGR